MIYLVDETYNKLISFLLLIIRNSIPIQGMLWTWRRLQLHKRNSMGVKWICKRDVHEM